MTVAYFWNVVWLTGAWYGLFLRPICGVRQASDNRGTFIVRECERGVCR